MRKNIFPTESHLTNSSADSLKRVKLASDIVDNILTKMELPNTLGIYGNWGTGKSTVLHFIDEKISKTKRLSKDIHIIHFQPWKYEYSKSNDLLFALLKEIQGSLNVSEAVWQDLASVALGMSGSLFSNLLKVATYNIVDIDDAVKRAEEWSVNIKKGVLPLYEAWSDQFEDIKSLFSKYISEGLSGVGKQKLFIFIDDLDRCLPENTIHLLESIKNYLYQEQTLFVLAIDHRVVSEMIEQKYGLHSGYGDEYLEKIINYQIELPRTDFRALLDQLLIQHNVTINDSPKRRISAFINEFISEPRRAKRILRQFLMRKYLSEEFDSAFSTDELVQHAFFATYLNMRFPKHFSGDNDKRWTKIKFARNLSQAALKNDGKYSQVALEDSSFSPKELKEIEAIFRFHFVKNDGRDEIIDIAQLNQAFGFLKLS